MTLFVGIDPGTSGAIVAIDADHRVVIAEQTPTLGVGKGRSRKLIMDEIATWTMLSSLPDGCVVALEKAQSMPGQGVSSTFGYGVGYGAWRMALTVLARQRGWAWHLVHPTTWNKAVLRDIEGDDTKARAVLRCQRTLPGLDLMPGDKRKPHTGLADAGCLALFAEMIHSNTLPSSGR